MRAAVTTIHQDAAMEDQLVRLSDLVRRPVGSRADGRLGRLVDVVIDFDDDRPAVRELLVRRARRAGDEVAVPWAAVEAVDHTGVVVAGQSERDLSPGPPAATDLRLVRDALDVQIVDLEGHRLVRVADVLLLRDDERLVVFGVDIGFGAVVRRVGFRRLAERLHPEVVLWSALHLTSRQGHTAQLALRSAHLQRLSSDDLAHLLSLLTVHHAVDVLEQAPIASAADAIERSPDEVGQRLLAALPEARSDELLRAMPAPRAHRLRHLLRRTPLPRRRYHRTRGWTRDAPRAHGGPTR
jgi:sporulation protein YlmC with PRC-barrel domain